MDQHPNVIKVRGFGRDRGKFFLVMEMLDGVTLRSILDDPSSEPVSEEEAFAVTRAVGDALKYAHAKGAIHGDIRPEKIFITEGYAVKVLDLLPASAPRTLPFFVEEAAPNGLESLDQRDDVYGLACLAYELFAGRHPYNANSPLEALNAGLNVAPILRLGAKRWEALARGLALRREHRTASVAAFLSELGVTGNEKLRPEAEAAASAPAASAPVAPAAIRTHDEDMPIVGDYSGSWQVRTQPTAPPPPPPPQPQRTSLAESTATWQRYPPRDFEMYAELPELPSRRERHEARPIFWGVALVAALAIVATVGVTWNYEPARNRAVAWIAEGATFAKTALSKGPQAPHVEPETTVATPPIAAVTPDQPASVANPVPDSSAASTRRRPARRPGRARRASGRLADSRSERAARIIIGAQNLPAALPAPNVATNVGPEVIEFANQVVTISEGQTVATVAIRRRGGNLSESSVVWWTGDGSAVADDDYANLGARIEKFAAGEDMHTIHIPLVGDSKPEGRESFYVNLRNSEAAGRRTDQSQRMEVVVVDDD